MISFSCALNRVSLHFKHKQSKLEIGVNMKLHCLSDYDYNELIFKSILNKSGFTSTLTISDSGIPTIGYNFNLQDDRVLHPVLNSLGFDVYGKHLKGDAAIAEKYYVDLIRSAIQIVNSNDVESLNNVIQSILFTRISDRRYDEFSDFNRVELLIYNDEEELSRCLSAVIKNIEKSLDHWLMSFELEIVNKSAKFLARNTCERAVLFSLAYQNVIGMHAENKPKLKQLGEALANDDRAEVWYHIRYNAFSEDNKEKVTIAQRYYESELFGLYDEGTHAGNISSNQCKQVYRMYHEYKNQIIEHEKHFSIYIGEANQHFNLSGINKIKTLEQSFQIAYNRIRCKKTNGNIEEVVENSTVQNNIPTLEPWKPVVSSQCVNEAAQQYHRALAS